MRSASLRAARSASNAARIRCLHQTSRRAAITKMQMPAMSPTMTEGGIVEWKKKEGEAFSAGDVLLEVETDKATIDVEAQEDGVMGKIIAADGSKAVPVGKVIALLAEEGDDISNLEVPKDEPAPEPKQEAAPTPSSPASQPPKADPPKASTPSAGPSAPPTVAHVEHSSPLFPSVSRLLALNNISDPSVVKGTGIRGMVTKGDVLTYLGKASGPLGTFKDVANAAEKKVEQPAEVKPLDGDAIRRMIVTTMLQKSLKARNPPPGITDASFESIIADYLPPQATSTTSTPSSRPSPKSQSSVDYLDGLI